MELNFDIRGNLYPYEIIEISLEDFTKIFINSFEEDSTRHTLFKKYQVYLDDISNLIGGDFYQWLAGSFISTKYNPKDIDFVTIMHHRDFEENLGLIEKKFSGSKARKIYEVDAYVLPDFTKDHPKHIFTQSDLLYWKNLFSKTRPSRSRKQFPRGFIQINFID